MVQLGRYCNTSMKEAMGFEPMETDERNELRTW